MVTQGPQGGAPAAVPERAVVRNRVNGLMRALVCQTETMPCRRARDWQRALQVERREGRVPDLLLLTEHPPTYTWGRATRPEHWVADAASLARQGISVLELERGGSVTYHGPGQLVGYPILDLRTRGRDVHLYLRQLEEVLVRTLVAFGVAAHARKGSTGVWAGRHKVAAIGVHVRHWVTTHGFALNVCPDLDHYRGIRPCGYEAESVTSMARLLPCPPTLSAVSIELRQHFAAVFGCRFEEIDPDGLRSLTLEHDPGGGVAPGDRVL